MWISPAFKLYLIKEFQRLKEIEQNNISIGWDIKRELAKVNYRIHTKAIQDYLYPTLSQVKQKYVYADEADLLNILVWGTTASIWKKENPELK
jgi:phage regulator Rha-like protein